MKGVDTFGLLYGNRRRMDSVLPPILYHQGKPSLMPSTPLPNVRESFALQSSSRLTTFASWYQKAVSVPPQPHGEALGMPSDKLVVFQILRRNIRQLHGGSSVVLTADPHQNPPSSSDSAASKYSGPTSVGDGRALATEDPQKHELEAISSLDTSINVPGRIALSTSQEYTELAALESSVPSSAGNGRPVATEDPQMYELEAISSLDTSTSVADTIVSSTSQEFIELAALGSSVTKSAVASGPLACGVPGKQDRGAIGSLHASIKVLDDIVLCYRHEATSDAPLKGEAENQDVTNECISGTVYEASSAAASNEHEGNQDDGIDRSTATHQIRDAYLAIASGNEDVACENDNGSCHDRSSSSPKTQNAIHGVIDGNEGIPEAQDADHQMANGTDAEDDEEDWEDCSDRSTPIPKVKGTDCDVADARDPEDCKQISEGHSNCSNNKALPVIEEVADETVNHGEYDHHSLLNEQGRKGLNDAAAAAVELSTTHSEDSACISDVTPFGSTAPAIAVNQSEETQERDPHMEPGSHSSSNSSYDSSIDQGDWVIGLGPHGVEEYKISPIPFNVHQLRESRETPSVGSEDSNLDETSPSIRKACTSRGKHPGSYHPSTGSTSGHSASVSKFEITIRPQQDEISNTTSSEKPRLRRQPGGVSSEDSKLHDVSPLTRKPSALEVDTSLASPGLAVLSSASRAPPGLSRVEKSIGARPSETGTARADGNPRLKRQAGRVFNEGSGGDEKSSLIQGPYAPGTRQAPPGHSIVASSSRKAASVLKPKSSISVWRDEDGHANSSEKPRLKKQPGRVFKDVSNTRSTLHNAWKTRADWIAANQKEDTNGPWSQDPKVSNPYLQLNPSVPQVEGSITSEISQPAWGPGLDVERLPHFEAALAALEGRIASPEAPGPLLRCARQGYGPDVLLDWDTPALSHPKPRRAWDVRKMLQNWEEQVASPNWGIAPSGMGPQIRPGNLMPELIHPMPIRPWLARETVENMEAQAAKHQRKRLSAATGPPTRLSNPMPGLLHPQPIRPLNPAKVLENLEAHVTALREKGSSASTGISPYKRPGNPTPYNAKYRYKYCDDL